jgi:DNA-binding MarR family transcriptional regulator
VRVALVYQKAFRALAERLTGVGLSVAQFDLLACLVKAEPDRLKQSELASRLLVTKGNISGMLSRMTELGTVKRADDPHDKRSKRIMITEQGRQLYEAGRTIQEGLVDEMFDGLNPDKLLLLEEVVGEICEKIKLTKS